MLYERYGPFPYTGALQSVTYEPGEWAPDAPVHMMDTLRKLDHGVRVTTHVVAMGGGGFLRHGEVSALDRYVLSLVDAPAPDVCFVPTASGDPQPSIDLFHRVFEALGCEHHHLSLFWRDEIPVGGPTVRDADVDLRARRQHREPARTLATPSVSTPRSRSAAPTTA